MTTKGLTLVIGSLEIHVLGHQEILPPVTEELTHVRNIFHLQIVAFILDAEALLVPADEVPPRE